MADGREKAGAKAEHQKGGGSVAQIFILRLWEQQESPGTWSGRVQHVLSGNARSFASLEALIECLAALLPETIANVMQERSDTTDPEAAQESADSRPEDQILKKDRSKEKGES